MKIQFQIDADNLGQDRAGVTVIVNGAHSGNLYLAKKELKELSEGLQKIYGDNFKIIEV